MDESPLSYSFDWRRTEHAQVTALLMRDQVKEAPWRILRWVVLLLLVLATVVTLASALLGDIGSALQLGLLTAVVGAFVFRFPEITGWIQAWRVDRADPNVGHPIFHSFSETGLEVAMKTLTAELRWSGMYAVKETPSMFLFYYSKRHAYYLPKRAIEDDTGIVRVRERIVGVLPDNIPFLKESLSLRPPRRSP